MQNIKYKHRRIVANLDTGEKEVLNNHGGVGGMTILN